MLVKKIKDSEVQMIHEKSLEILESVGVNFEHREILEVFKKEESGWMDRGCILNALWQRRY